MRASLISAAALKGVRRVSVVRERADAGERSVRELYVRADSDPEDVFKVSVVRPGYGVVKRFRIEQHRVGRKKQTRMLRPIEKGIRKLARREVEIATNYLDRHELSNRRKPNGWIKDLPRNLSRSFQSDD